MNPEAIAHYRREGYLVVSRVLDRDHVDQCLAALTALAADPALEPGKRDGTGAFVALEPGTDPAAADRADLIRKFGDFTDASPPLLRAAMSARLHAVLDALMGQGRVLLQEMALVKPPKVSGDKPWHQDAAYFRGSDPNLMFGVWIALDPATLENGCMEVIPGRTSRVRRRTCRHQDINLCTVRPDLVRLRDRVALPMEPGDVLIFSQPDPPLHRGQSLQPAAAGVAVPLPPDRAGMDLAGGAPRAVPRRGWRICRLHGRQGRAIRRGFKLRADADCGPSYRWPRSRCRYPDHRPHGLADVLAVARLCWRTPNARL